MRQFNEKLNNCKKSWAEKYKNVKENQRKGKTRGRVKKFKEKKAERNPTKDEGVEQINN